METFSIILTSTMIKIFYYNYTIFLLIKQSIYILIHYFNQYHRISIQYQYQAGAKVSI